MGWSVKLREVSFSITFLFWSRLKFIGKLQRYYRGFPYPLYTAPFSAKVPHKHTSETPAHPTPAAQWLAFLASIAGGVSSISDRGSKIQHAMGWGQKKKVTLHLSRLRH